MIATVGDASPRQARGHIGDDFVKWKHYLNDVADVADQTGTVRGRIERVEMSLKPGFHMIIAVIVSICRRLIGDTSPMYRSRSLTVTIIWKPGLKQHFHNHVAEMLRTLQNYISVQRHCWQRHTRECRMVLAWVLRFWAFSQSRCRNVKNATELHFCAKTLLAKTH